MNHDARAVIMQNGTPSPILILSSFSVSDRIEKQDYLDSIRFGATSFGCIRSLLTIEVRYDSGTCGKWRTSERSRCDKNSSKSSQYRYKRQLAIENNGYRRRPRGYRKSKNIRRKNKRNRRTRLFSRDLDVKKYSNRTFWNVSAVNCNGLSSPLP